MNVPHILNPKEVLVISKKILRFVISPIQHAWSNKDTLKEAKVEQTEDELEKRSSGQRWKSCGLEREEADKGIVREEADKGGMVWEKGNKGMV